MFPGVGVQKVKGLEGLVEEALQDDWKRRCVEVR
jgi:hypothetical protein